MISPDVNLRALREKLGLTMEDVEAASSQLVRKHNNERYMITISGVSDFESQDAVPSIHQLYALAIIYRREFSEMLSWYGVDLNQTAADLETSAPPRTHLSYALPSAAEIQKSVRIDPSFDPRTTSTFAPMVRQWGPVPVAYLQELSKKEYIYGYIGSEDLMMQPLIPPGRFIQVDESRHKLLEGRWRSEYERPIYFVETRKGYTCSWCIRSGDDLILLPHSLSPVAPSVIRAKGLRSLGKSLG